MLLSMAFVLFVLILMTQDTVKSGDRDIIVRVVPRDAIPAIDQPVFVEATKAVFMRDEELIIGLAGGTTHKAYSTWLLDNHEIVNDVIGSTPIAVTW